MVEFQRDMTCTVGAIEEGQGVGYQDRPDDPNLDEFGGLNPSYMAGDTKIARVVTGDDFLSVTLEGDLSQGFLVSLQCSFGTFASEDATFVPADGSNGYTTWTWAPVQDSFVDLTVEPITLALSIDRVGAEMVLVPDSAYFDGYGTFAGYDAISDPTFGALTPAMIYERAFVRTLATSVLDSDGSILLHFEIEGDWPQDFFETLECSVGSLNSADASHIVREFDFGFLTTWEWSVDASFTGGVEELILVDGGLPRPAQSFMTSGLRSQGRYRYINGRYVRVG